MHAIYTEKKSYNIIFHVCADLMPQDNTLKNIATQLSELMDQLGEYYIVIGDTVEGKENVYKSYSSAVILLQKSFFEKPRIIITKKEEKRTIRQLHEGCGRQRQG